MSARLYDWVILYWCYFKIKQNYNTPTVPCKKSKMVSFPSLKMKNIIVFAFPSPTRFFVKLIYVALGSASSACCYHFTVFMKVILIWWGN